MFIANNGEMTVSFAEDGITTTGTVTKSPLNPNALTTQRQQEEKNIVDYATATGQEVGTVIHKLLHNNIAQLQSYVQSRGEVPAKSSSMLAIQAALLRAMEIGAVAKAIDTSDDDALKIIESAEYQAVFDNTLDADQVMNPDTSAAVDLLVARMASKHKSLGGSGSMRDVSASLKSASGASTFDGVNCGFLAHTASSFGGNGADDSDDWLSYYQSLMSGGTTTTTTTTGTTSTSSGSFWDNLFNTIDKVTTGITKVGEVVTSATGATGGILDSVKDVGSDIGSDSISKYIAENWWKWMLAVLALIILTIILIRATRK